MTSVLTEEISAYCLSKPEAREDFPFGPQTQVVKVGGKMFALILEYQGRAAINLKCDPLQAQQLRDVWDGVIAGYHMNKRHWNTVFIDGDVPRSEIERLVDHAYALVVRGLRKAERTRLETLHGVETLYCGE